MTDPAPVPAELLELANAVVDDVATPVERARAETDPQVRALVEDLRRASRAVRQPVPVDGRLRDQAIAAALDTVIASQPAHRGTRSGPVRSLEAARARHRRPRFASLVGVAAATVLGVGVGVALTHRGGTDHASAELAPAAGRALPASGTPESVAKRVPLAPAATDTAGGATASSPAPDPLGASSLNPQAADIRPANSADTAAGSGPHVANTVEEIPALVTALAAQRQAGAAAPTDDPCPSQHGEVAGFLDWQGTQAGLYLTPSLAAPTIAVIVEVNTCATLATVPLPG